MNGSTPTRLAQVRGCVVGTAIGDALGLPYENLSPQRAAKMLGPPERHRFLFGRGLASDDTEHTCLITQALIASAGDEAAFVRDFARRLRHWLLGLPAGLGRATLLSCLRLWFGWPTERSGVFSAGNAPAMRVAVLGIIIEDPAQLARLVRISSRITHTDPKAEWAALAVALAAWTATRNLAAEVFLQQLDKRFPTEAEELLELIRSAFRSSQAGASTPEFAASRGWTHGVSGYCYQSVPVALHAWLRFPADYRSAVIDAISCGGDADTIAAITGGLVGIRAGRSGIPTSWERGYADWPRTLDWMERLAAQLDEDFTKHAAQSPLSLPAYQLLPRNLLFLGLVLTHGFRRLGPPY